jgi:hypothetical protein
MKVTIIADEFIDAAGHFIVSVLLQPLDAFGEHSCKAKRINTDFLKTVHNATMGQAIICTLISASVDSNNVLPFVSDIAAHIKAGLNNSLCGILPNAVRVTCWAHILSLVGKQLRCALEMTDGFITSRKAVFSKAPGRCV